MINSPATVKTSDVSTALSFFIQLGMVVSVDNEGYVFSLFDPEHKRVKIGGAEHEKPVVVYQEELPKEDVYVINPFAEGLGVTPPQVFIYKVMRSALNARLSYAVYGVLTQALEQHKLLTPATKSSKKDADIQLHAQPGQRIVEILTRKVVNDKTLIDEVDEAMVEEFRKFFDAHGDAVIEPVYKSSVQRSEIHCRILDDPSFIANRVHMRKKSILVLQTIIRGILNLAPGEFTDRYGARRIENTPSKFSSWLQAIYQLYGPINEVIDVLPDDTAPDHLVDLDTYQYHIDRLPAYTNNAKWMVQGAPPAAIPATRVPGGASIIPQLTPIQQHYQPPLALAESSAPAGYKLMPGIMMADGTRGPPVMIPDPASFSQMPVAGMMPQQPMYGMPMQAAPQMMMPGMMGMQQPQYGQQQQPQWMQPQPGYGQPTTINPLMARQQQQPMGYGGFGQQQQQFPQQMNTGYSGVPGMPPLR